MSTHILETQKKTKEGGFLKRCASKLSAATAVAAMSALVMGDAAFGATAIDTQNFESSSSDFSIASLFGIGTVTADARTVWDFSNSGSGGGGVGGWQAAWQTAYSSGSTSAWGIVINRRAAATSMPATSSELISAAQQYGNVPRRTLDQCRQSNRADSWIWYSTMRSNDNLQRSYPSLMGTNIRRDTLSTTPRSPLRATYRTQWGSYSTSSRGATVDEWSAFLDHRQNGRTGRADWNTGSVGIICSTPDLEEEANGPTVSRGTATYRITRQFGSTETVSRRCDNAFATINQSPGLTASMNNQRSTPVINQSAQTTRACGTLYGQINRGERDGASRASIISAINTASGSSLTNVTGQLSANNRTALAEGNVVNVDMRTRDITINWSQRSTATRTASTYCEYWYEETDSGGLARVIEVNCNQNSTPRTARPSGSNSGVETGARCSSGAWVGGTSARNSALDRYLGSRCPHVSVNPDSQTHPGWSTNSVSTGQSRVTGSLHEFSTDTFYQTMGVTCNVTDFDSAISAMDTAGRPGATTERSTASSRPNDKNFSALAYSGKRTGNAAATAVANRDWGRSNHANTNLARTGTLAFYTKECNFSQSTGNGGTSPDRGHQHASNPTSGQSFGTLANAVNRDRSNGTGENIFGPGSAAREGMARNELTFTRDNAGDVLEFQVSSPNVSSSSSLVRVNNNGLPVRTLVSRWSEGTPGMTSEGGGQFRVQALNNEGSSIGDAFTGTSNFPTITNVQAPAASSNSTVTIFDRGVNKFDVRANWNSESDRPEILNVAWGYDVDINTAIHRGIRPASNGTARYNFGSYTTPNNVVTNHYGRSQADFSGANNYNTNNHIYRNTGHGTRYTPAQQDSSVTWRTDARSSNNLVINFVRSVSER